MSEEEKTISLIFLCAFIVATPIALILLTLAGAGTAAGIFSIMVGATVALVVATVAAFIA